MAGYIGTKAAVVTPGAERKKVFSITTTTSSLTGLAYTPGFVHVFHNGVRLVDGTDYTATNGTSITLTTAAQNGDEVVVISYATFEVADAYTKAESDDRYVNVTGDTMTGALAVNGNLTVDTNTLFVDAANNRVGIGTSSPGARLQVDGNTAQYSASIAVRASGNGNQYEFGHSNTGGYGSVIGAEVGSGAPFIAFQAGAGTNNNTYRTFGIAGSVISTNNAGSLTFNSVTNANADNQSLTERMRIDSSGKIAAGGTATNGRLTIAQTGINPFSSIGNSAITTYGAYGGGIAMVDSNDPNSGTGYLLWTDDSGNDFNIARGGTGTAVSGGVYINDGAGSWSSRSDERDKTNLEPITDAASKVQSLRAVIGEYIWDEGVRHPFLIAQDVQAVLPEAVSVANKSALEEDQRLGISYTDMVPLLTAALQEALTKIDALEARIVILEGGAA